MADLTNVESAWLRAVARFEDWRIEFDRKFYAPAGNMVIGMLNRQLQGLPPEIQQMSRQMNPEQWKDVDQMTKGIEQKKKREVRYGV